MYFSYFHVMRRAASVGVLVLATSACGGSDTSAPAPASTASVAAPATTASSTTTTAVPPTSAIPATTVAVATTSAPKTQAEQEAEIIEAYLQGWDAWIQVLYDPQAPLPESSASRSGSSLELLIEKRDQMLRDGELGRPGTDALLQFQPRVESVSGDIATVRDCIVDDIVLFSSETNEIVDDSISTASWLSRMVRTDGIWTLDFSDRQEVRPGATNC